MFKSLLISALLTVSVSAMAEHAPRTITVSGTGSAEMAPDGAYVRMSIVTRDRSLSSAQSAVAKVSASVLALTDRLKIDRERVDTSGASVRPDYRWNREKEQQELRGYIAERQVTVDIRDLEDLAQVIEGCVAAGVNQVSAPELYSSKHRDGHREALEKAALDARANAERLARSLGAKLGPVLQINAAPNNSPPPGPQARMLQSSAAEGGAEASYNAADLSYQATISVVFELQES